MSYFGTCLDEMIKRKRMKAVDLAKQSGVGESLISRYRSGEQVWVSPEDLEKLSKALTTEPEEQAEILRAHLLDECHGPGSELITISYSGHRLQELPTPYQTVRLPDELERHMATIREFVIKDRNVREIVEGLGNLLRIGDCGTDSELGKRVNSPAKKEGTAESVLDSLAEDIAKRGKRSGGSQKTRQ